MGSVKFVPPAKMISSTGNLNQDARGPARSGAKIARNQSAFLTTLYSAFPATKPKRESQGTGSHQVVAVVATPPVAVVVVPRSLPPMEVGEVLEILMVMEGSLALHT